MKYSQAKTGRVFVLRLEHGDIVHEKIEHFAQKESIDSAAMIIVGGADKGSRFVVGPEDGEESPVVPLERMLMDVHEITGTGTLFPDNSGNPVLHMHMACGREEETMTGCVRRGVRVWHVMEVVLLELTEAKARRILDQGTGFMLLEP